MDLLELPAVMRRVATSRTVILTGSFPSGGLAFPPLTHFSAIIYVFSDNYTGSSDKQSPGYRGGVSALLAAKRTFCVPSCVLCEFRRSLPVSQAGIFPSSGSFMLEIVVGLAIFLLVFSPIGHANQSRINDGDGLVVVFRTGQGVP